MAGVRHQLIQHLLRHKAIRGNHCNRFQRLARIPPAQRKVRNVDAVRSENIADVADHSGNIQILQQNQRPAERRFAVNAIHMHQPRLIKNDRAFHRRDAGVCLNFNPDRIRMAQPLIMHFRHAPAAVGRELSSRLRRWPSR